MRKATKTLVLAAAAAFGLSACSDDVTVVEPPPGPPPDGDDPAELSVKSIEDNQGNNLDVDDLSGNIVVVLNVESGDQQISELQLTVDDQTRTCQSFGSGAVVEGASGAQVEIECVLNTAQAAGECTGEQIAPAFANGPHALGAQLVLADGGTVSATNTIDVNFTNTDHIVLAREGGNEAVSGGERYVGGADVTWHACPVMYTGATVGEITLDVTTMSATVVTIDGGLTSEAPFSFLAVAADNDGVEDANAQPHTIEVSTVVSDEGVPLTGDFASLPSEDVHLDFTGPDVGVATVQIDEAVVTNDLYSAGVFTTDGITDGGAGVDDAASTFLVSEGGSVADTVVDGAAGLDDLEEDDANAYDGHLTLSVDRVGNATAVTVGDVSTAASFGKDATPPAVSGEAPADAGVVLNDTHVQFEAVDPELREAGSGEAGSGVGTITAETDEDMPTSLTVAAAAADTFTADVSVLADGAYVVTATVPDQAVLDPNQSETSFDFILDTTDPAMNLTTFPQGGNTQASSAQLTIGGDVSDLNGLSAATVTVRADGTDASGTLADGTCQATDYELDPDADEVDQNAVDITDSADAFSETFVIERPGATSVKYCFFVDADDTAVDRHGDAAPNQGAIQTNTDVTWQ